MAKKLLLIFLVGTTLIVCLFKCSDLKTEGRKINFQAQLGIYALDIQKTDLGEYKKDSNTYKKLLITFKADSTFIMNRKAPFIYDSIGRWEAGDMKEWNFLYYKSWKYSKRQTGDQFTRTYLVDSTYYFLLNSATPQKGAKSILEIYFKKINL